MAEVKLFCWEGLISAPVVAGTRLSYDSVQMFKHPYLGAETLSPSTGTAASSDEATAPASTQVALIQVQPGKRVAYELTPGGHDLRVATSASPTLSGDATLQFGPGWRISVIELA